MTTDDTPDGRLIDRFLAGRGQAAFAGLVRRHGPMVLGTCRRVLGNPADADDAFQAVLLVLVRRAGEFRGRATVGDVLHGVAVRTALKARAAAMTRRAKEAAAVPRAAPDPAAAEAAEAVDAELARLPPKTVAERLGILGGALSSRLAAARKLRGVAGRRRPGGSVGAGVAGRQLVAGAGRPRADHHGRGRRPVAELRPAHGPTDRRVHRLRRLGRSGLSRGDGVRPPAAGVRRAGQLRVLPPFEKYVNRLRTQYLGADYHSIAKALRDGRGFADPFESGGGPTAWMPPVLPGLLAGLLWAFRDDTESVRYAVVTLQGLALVLTVLAAAGRRRLRVRPAPPLAGGGRLPGPGGRPVLPSLPGYPRPLAHPADAGRPAARGCRPARRPVVRWGLLGELAVHVALTLGPVWAGLTVLR